MNSDETGSNKAWSFVHGEMDEEAQKEFKEMMAQDQDLRKEIEEVKQTNAYLRTLMPLLDQSEQDLEENLLQAWEATQEEEAHQDKKKDNAIPFPAPRKRKEPILLRPQARLVLAMAACILVFVGVYHYTASPIKWMAPEIVPIKYRGENIEGVYTPQELKQYASQLKSTIDERYESLLAEAKTERQPSKARPWTLHMRMQEINGGTLRVDVKAYKKDNTVPIQSWSEFYESKDLFQSEIDNFSASVSTYLIQFGQR